MPRFSDFTGGLWLPEDRTFAVPPEALLEADNIEFDFPTGGVRGRRGLSRYASSLGGPIRRLHRHYPRTGAPSTLAAVDAGSQVDWVHDTDDTGTFTTVTGGSGFPDDTLFGFVVWPAKNASFLTLESGGLYQYDPLSGLATVTPSGDNEIDLDKLGPHLTLHKNRLFATHVDERNFSVYASEVNDQTTWLSASQISLNDPEGGKVTALVSFRGLLLGFKSTSAFYFFGDVGTGLSAQLERFLDIGCVAPQTASVTPYGVMFLSHNGLYLTDGVNPQPEELTAPIRSLFRDRDTQTVYPDAVGRWYPRKQQYVLKLDPEASDAYILQRYNVLANNPFTDTRARPVWAWSHHTNLPCTALEGWDSEEDDQRLLLGAADGHVRTYDTGTEDDGDSFLSSFETARRLMDNSARTGRVYRVKLLHRAPDEVSVGVRYDEDTADAVTVTLGDTDPEQKYHRATVTDLSKLGRLFGARVVGPTGAGAGFEVHAIDLDVRLQSPRLWRNDNP